MRVQSATVVYKNINTNDQFGVELIIYIEFL